MAGTVGIAALVFVLWWFQPQALLFDDVVDERFPIGAADAEDDGSRDGIDQVEGPTDDAAVATGDDLETEEVEAAPSGPIELAVGSFVSRNRYAVTGTATTYQLQDGQRILRLEDFESTNGPDLFVYLTVAGAGDSDTALAADFIDLGALSGNIGNQNYEIPTDVDLDRYDSVVIWCRRFTASFGVADLA